MSALLLLVSCGLALAQDPVNRPSFGDKVPRERQGGMFGVGMGIGAPTGATVKAWMGDWMVETPREPGRSTTKLKFGVPPPSPSKYGPTRLMVRLSLSNPKSPTPPPSYDKKSLRPLACEFQRVEALKEK